MRRKLLLGLAVLIAAGTAGGAYAATQSDSNPQQAFLNDAAKRLNVSPSQLRSALTGAFLDRLNAAVAAGRLTQAEANRIKQRIEQGRGLPLGPPRGPRLGMRGHHLGPLHAAAGYLGVSQAQLLSDLRNGQTLAQVANAHGKSVAGLEQALITQAKDKIQRLTAAGIISKAQAQRIENRLQTRIDQLVNHGLPRLGRAPGPYGPPAGGPALQGPPPPGGPAVGGAVPVAPPGA